jgi:protein-tyrosine-phosphatase
MAFQRDLLALRQGCDPILSHIQISSAGMLPRQGTRSPAIAIEAARLAGVDLSSHRSGHLEREMAEQASLLVVFDARNMRWLRQRYPHITAPSILLGSFYDKTQKTEIADPDGGDLTTFQTTYTEIENSLAGLLSALREAVARRIS